MKNSIDALIRSIIFLATVAVISGESPPAPAEKAQLNKWFEENVKPLAARTAVLDPELVAAEQNSTVVKVMADGSGDFKTVTAAIASVPADNTKRVVIWIGKGVYTEKLKIDRNKPFVTLYGSPDAMPTLSFNGDANKYGTVYSATLIVESDYFVAANLIIENTSPRPDATTSGGQALAARLMGTKAAVYNCKFIGFQDTLCDDDGLHLYKDCFIQGTVDFIFGKGTTLYLNSQIDVAGDGGLAVITAHSREEESDKSGYSFVHCNITGTGGQNTYLGRAWKSKSRTVFAYTNMADIIHPEGWNDMNHDGFDATVSFGEYKNSGPGSVVVKRVKFGKQLTNVEVKPYLSLDHIHGEKWLLPPPNQPLASSGRPLVLSAKPLSLSGQPLSPSGQPLSPSAQPLSPSGQPLPPSAQPLSPSGQPLPPSAQPLSPSAQPLSPSGKPLSRCQPLSPSGQPLSPSTQTLSPSGQPLSPSGQPLSPSAQPFSPSGQPLPPSAQPLSPSDEPSSSSDKPSSPSDEPLSPSGKPSSPSNKPSSPSDEPLSPSDEPSSPSDKPSSPSDEPLSTFDEPSSPSDKPLPSSNPKAAEL